MGMVNNVTKEFVDCQDQFERLLGDTEKPLYVGYANNFTMLSTIVRIF